MKSTVLSLKFLFILLIFYFPSYSQKYFENGKKEYLEGDLTRAVELLTKSIENNEEVAKSYMFRGAARSFLRIFPEAWIDLNQSKKIDNTNDKLYYYFGKYYLLKGIYDSALYYFNISIAKDAQDAAAYDARATAKGLLNDFKGAIEDENIAIKLDPTKQIYYTDRGFAKFQLGLFNEAIEDFNSSLAIEPNHKAFANRGYAYSGLGLHSMAIDDFTKALEIMPGDYEIFYKRGMSYLSIGKKKEACLDLTKSSDMGYEPASKQMKENGCK